MHIAFLTGGKRGWVQPNSSDLYHGAAHAKAMPASWQSRDPGNVDMR